MSRTGSSTYCRSKRIARSPNASASFKDHPRFASHRSATSGPTASRIASTRSASAAAPAAPEPRATLIFKHRYPCLTSAAASRAADSGVSPSHDAINALISTARV